jgi:thiamine pyrophosphokinase
MEEGICYIFGAGEQFDRIQLPKEDDYVIAADGGYLYAKKHNIKPDLLIGDFDSLNDRPIDIKTKVLPTIKDETDMLAAINVGFKKGFRIFYIYGGTGKRIDHTFANVACLSDIAYRGGRGFLFDDNQVITAIHNDSISFPAIQSGFISVFSFSNKAIGVTEKGLKYALNNHTLYNSYPLGVSNEFIGDESCISVENGTLIVTFENYF